MRKWGNFDLERRSGVDGSELALGMGRAEGRMRETGELAKDLWGEKTYQRCAREALPLLVRQAEAGEKI